MNRMSLTFTGFKLLNRNAWHNIHSEVKVALTCSTGCHDAENVPGNSWQSRKLFGVDLPLLEDGQCCVCCLVMLILIPPSCSPGASAGGHRCCRCLHIVNLQVHKSLGRISYTIGCIYKYENQYVFTFYWVTLALTSLYIRNR